jgi:GSH-dependent disulfide-bond oxidoreductase
MANLQADGRDALSNPEPSAARPVPSGLTKSPPPANHCLKQARGFADGRRRLHSENGGQFASINRPTAGAREEQELPVGEHPFQLYSLGTPNGQKVTIMFEELLEAGHSRGRIRRLADQLRRRPVRSGFVDLNPNSKIPALLDRSGPEPFRVFESGAILLHLAEKFGACCPRPQAAPNAFQLADVADGQRAVHRRRFGHFYAYAPNDTNTRSTAMRWRPSGCSMWPTSAWRRAEFLAGDDYTIADIPHHCCRRAPK